MSACALLASASYPCRQEKIPDFDTQHLMKKKEPYEVILILQDPIRLESRQSFIKRAWEVILHRALLWSSTDCNYHASISGESSCKSSTTPLYQNFSIRME
jgi:hypothetical protein